MRLSLKILTAHIVLLLAGTGIFGLINQDMEAFIFLYGLLAVLTAAVDLLIALASLFPKKRNVEVITGCLLSAGFLLLTGLFSLSQISFSR